MIVHWDDVERERCEWEPATSAYWTDLGRAAGSVGVRRMEIEPEKRAVPVHVHTAEEEIAFVLSGSGFSWQEEKRYRGGRVGRA